MKKLLLASIGLSALVLWAVSCGGGGSSPTPTSPSNTPTAQTGTTVNIVGTAGSGAFNPNPVQVPSGGSIVWRNTTAVTHVLVMENGAPIGTVAPGASLTTTLNGNGGNFKCTNHPSMVGSINGAAAPEPPADKGDGY